MIPMTEYPAAQMMKGRRRALRAQDPEGVRQNILAIATDEITRYFHTASSDRRSLRWKMSGATERVVDSIPTQSSPTWCETATRVAEARNASRQETNARPPRGSSRRS